MAASPPAWNALSSISLASPDSPIPWAWVTLRTPRTTAPPPRDATLPTRLPPSRSARTPTAAVLDRGRRRLRGHLGRRRSGGTLCSRVGGDIGARTCGTGRERTGTGGLGGRPGPLLLARPAARRVARVDRADLGSGHRAQRCPAWESGRLGPLAHPACGRLPTSRPRGQTGPSALIFEGARIRCRRRVPESGL